MGQAKSPFERRPDFIDSKFEYRDEVELTLYLQLLNPQTVSGLYFEASDNFLHRDFLNHVAEKSAMKKIDFLPVLVKEEARAYDFKGEVFPIVLMGLEKISDELTGREQQQDVEVKESDRLICRCFGVYESEIIKVLENAESPALKMITDETMAGGGCGSCLKDLKVFHSYYAPSEDSLISSKGMSEVELTKNISEALAVDYKEFRISRVIGTDIWVETDLLDPFVQLDEMKEKVGRDLGLPLRFHLL